MKNQNLLLFSFLLAATVINLFFFNSHDAYLLQRLTSMGNVWIWIASASMALVFLGPVAALIFFTNRKNPRYRAFGAVAAGLCVAVAFGNILTYTNGKAR